MTTQEIRDLIASKVAGQGSAIDAGSVLPQILGAICDAIDEGGGGGAEEILRARPTTSPMQSLQPLSQQEPSFLTTCTILQITTRSLLPGLMR